MSESIRNIAIGCIFGTLLGMLVLTLMGALPGTLPDRQMASYRECGTAPQNTCLGVVIDSGEIPPSTTYSPDEGAVSCTTTSGTVIAANTSRGRVKIINQSVIEVFICEGTVPCTTTVGQRLNEFAGFEETLYRGIYTCITESGTATLYVSELTAS